MGSVSRVRHRMKKKTKALDNPLSEPKLKNEVYGYIAGQHKRGALSPEDELWWLVHIVVTTGTAGDYIRSRLKKLLGTEGRK
jgi:hypothetical protein